MFYYDSIHSVRVKTSCFVLSFNCSFSIFNYITEIQKRTETTLKAINLQLTSTEVLGSS